MLSQKWFWSSEMLIKSLHTLQPSSTCLHKLAHGFYYCLWLEEIVFVVCVDPWLSGSSVAQAVTWPLIYVAFLLFPIVLKGVLIQVGLFLNWQKVLNTFLVICNGTAFQVIQSISVFQWQSILDWILMSLYQQNLALCMFNAFSFTLSKSVCLCFLLGHLSEFKRNLLHAVDLCRICEQNCAYTSLWQKLVNACHALTCCCHGSMTQQASVRWLLCPSGAGDVKPPPTMKEKHWAMWIIQISISGGRKGGYHLSMLKDLDRLC